MRIIYMGTPDFAVPALVALAMAGHEGVAVYSQPPRPAGRGKALRPSPVQAQAEQMGIEVRTPVSLKDPEVQSAFAALNADVAVVAAYGPSDEAERGPWNGIAVRGPRSVDEYRKIDPRLDQAILHMNDLPAERVLKAARKLLAERVNAGA